MNMAKSKKITSEAKNKMMSLKKNEAGRIVLVRILIILFIDILVASLFDFVKSEGMREFAFHTNVLPVLKYVFLGMLILSIVYLFITIIKKIDTSAHVITPAMIIAICTYLSSAALFYDKFRISPVLFYTITVIVSVLFAVYYIYSILLYKK